MAIDFPDSPSNNDQFTVGTTTWTYNGTAWVVSLGDASIATGAITADKIASDAITTAKIAAGAVVEADIANNAVTQDKLASTLSGITVCTSSTRPGSPFDGQVIYETDTDATKVWNGSAWVGATNAASLNDVGAAWTSFTPVWTSTGTQPAIGNGSLTGKFCRINKLVIGNIALISGGTTNFGTGSYLFNFPITAASPIFAYGTILSEGVYYDSNVGGGYKLTASFNAGSTANFRIQVYTNASQTYQLLGATSPVTFVSPDEILITFCYEVV
jgi:hypothetical protein